MGRRRARAIAAPRSSPRPNDAARRDAGQLALAAILGRQLVAIGAGRAAGNVALMVACVPGGGEPGAVINHRAFDRKGAVVVVGYDQEKRLAVGHERLKPFLWISSNSASSTRPRCLCRYRALAQHAPTRGGHRPAPLTKYTTTELSSTRRLPLLHA